MEFEFDDVRSQANKAKHGIDFLKAQAMWFDGLRVEVPAPTDDEPRFLVVGMMSRNHWSAVITHRQGKIRLISARRARPEEVALYEG